MFIFIHLAFEKNSILINDQLQSDTFSRRNHQTERTQNHLNTLEPVKRGKKNLKHNLKNTNRSFLDQRRRTTRHWAATESSDEKACREVDSRWQRRRGRTETKMRSANQGGIINQTINPRQRMSARWIRTEKLERERRIARGSSGEERTRHCARTVEMNDWLEAGKGTEEYIGGTWSRNSGKGVVRFRSVHLFDFILTTWDPTVMVSYCICFPSPRFDIVA